LLTLKDIKRRLRDSHKLLLVKIMVKLYPIKIKVSKGEKKLSYILV